MSDAWELHRLEVLTSKVGSGATPRGGGETYKLTGVPLIRSMNVVFFGFKREGLAYIDEAQAGELSNVVVEPDDVLLNITGASIGRVTLAPADLAGARVNQHVCIIRPTGALNARFLRAYLSGPEMQDLIWADNFGVTRQALTKQQILDFKVPVPPLAEQIRIADQLDTLLARIQACNDHLDAIPALLKRFRQAVLDAALFGALTDGDSGSDSVAVYAPISAVAFVGTGSTPLRSNQAFFSTNGTPWVTSAATASAVITQANEFVTLEAIAAHRLRLYPKGTLLVAMYGEGKTRGQVAELGIHAAINQACAAIVVDEDKAIRSYVKLALQANYLAMRELAEGGNQPNLNLSKVKDFRIPLPPLARQHQIVQDVRRAFAFADLIEARSTAARAEAQRLTPLVLAKAFRGALVAQDPLDEPASAMLARLAKQPAVRKPPVGEQLPAVPKASPAQAPSVDWNTLPDGAWANLAPADAASQAVVQGVHLAAVLKAFGAPAPAMHVRLAALLSLQPRCLPATLDKALLRQWRRLVGAEADPLPATVVRLTSRTDASWRQAVASLRARGDLIENVQAGTWAPGASLARIQTAGWPDGRARWLVHMLRKQDTARLLQAMVPVDQAFVHGQAA